MSISCRRRFRALSASTPVGDQLRWALDDLVPGVQAPSLEDVRGPRQRRVPAYMVPAEALVDVFRETVDDRE
jgi:hypothetical protein